MTRPGSAVCTYNRSYRMPTTQSEWARSNGSTTTAARDRAGFPGLRAVGPALVRRCPHGVAAQGSVRIRARLLREVCAAVSVESMSTAVMQASKRGEEARAMPRSSSKSSRPPRSNSDIFLAGDSSDFPEKPHTATRMAEDFFARCNLLLERCLPSIWQR